MFELIKNNKYTVGIIILLLMLTFAYQYYTRLDTDNDVQQTDSVEKSIEEQVGSETRQLLNRINTINLSTDILTNPAYSSLQDFGYTVQLKQQGTRNPFAPIGQSTDSDVR